MFSILKPIRNTRRLMIAIAFLGSALSSHAQQYLYGLTQKGGYYNKGVPYRIKTAGTEFVSYSDFDGQAGERPGNGAGFLQIPGPITFLSFLTEYGDQNQSYGIYLSVLANIGGLNGSAHRFDVGSNGSNPAGKLVFCTDGSIAGMTSSNGQFSGGAVFSTEAMDPNFLRTLVAFDGAQKGRSPKGSLILGPDGKLFGMTELGGVNDKGVVFSVQKSGPNADYQKLLDFDGAATGSNPTGNLLLATDGKLYGMTRDGGAGGLGVVFRINTDGSGFMKLFDFNGTASGSHPNGSLVQFTDGNLYGMAASGGVNGFGTVFTITTTGSFNKILDFDNINGKSPLGDLLVEPTGTEMYGVTFSGGTNDEGVLFKLTGGSTYTKLYDYSSPTGSNPVGSLLMIRPSAVLSFSALSEKNTLTAPFTPEVNSPVLPVYFTSSDPTVAVIENNQVKIKGAGAVYITAYQLDTYAFIGQTVTQLLIVKKAPQTITFLPVTSKTYGDAPFALSATSSSGLPVSFGAFSNDVLSFDGALWTIKAGGEVTVRASQSGNDIYAEAIPVDQKIVVNKAEQTITFNPTATIPCCQAFGLIATTTSQEEVLFRSDDPDIISTYSSSAYPNKSGQVKLIAYHLGNSRFKPAEMARSITVQKSAQTIGFSLSNTTLTLGDPPVFT
ncbi:MAG TPA: choice-of-anchor tandem repeat GloVer-containing protein, partial [Cyclobacteriaceae bacterium]|nr:choice-of-anchor tandem repeat GloVer-containing protein [Cyclobacteriaceae bacterium]